MAARPGTAKFSAKECPNAVFPSARPSKQLGKRGIVMVVRGRGTALHQQGFGLAIMLPVVLGLGPAAALAETAPASDLEPVLVSGVDKLERTLSLGEGVAIAASFPRKSKDAALMHRADPLEGTRQLGIIVLLLSILGLATRLLWRSHYRIYWSSRDTGFKRARFEDARLGDDGWGPAAETGTGLPGDRD